MIVIIIPLLQDRPSIGDWATSGFMRWPGDFKLHAVTSQLQVGIAGGTASRVGRHRGWNGPSGQDSGPQRAEEQSSSTNGLTKVRQHIYSIEMTIVIIISPLGSCMALLGFASQSPTGTAKWPWGNARDATFKMRTLISGGKMIPIPSIGKCFYRKYMAWRVFNEAQHGLQIFYTSIHAQNATSTY